MSRAWVAALLAAPWACGAVPSTADWAHCAGIAAPDVRLACYDAVASDAGLAGAAATAAAASAAPAPPAGALSAAAAAPTPAASPIAAPTVATAAPTVAASAAAPAAAPEDPKNFGFSPAQQHVAYGGVKSESARIVTLSTGGFGQAVVVLDNGQTWKVTDDDGAISQGNQVTIKRAALGSFLMVAPSHHVYRVRRIG